MPEIRAIISLIFKISFAILIAILMILWIVTAAQGVNEAKQVEAQRRPGDRNQQFVPDKRTLDRVKGILIFNAILYDVIGLSAIIGVILSHRYILHTSMILLTIIWFVGHYRITEYVVFGSPTMIAAHIINFFVVLIGLPYTNFVKEGPKPREKTSKIRDNSNNGTTKA